MDSDDSRDGVSSGSDSESNTKGPHSPSSIQSADSQEFKPRQSPRGPRSPSPCGPRSPSPEGSIQSNSPINSPKGSPRSPVDYNDTIKSPSANSVSSHGDENTINSVKSHLDEDGNLSPKSTSSHSSVKSQNSVKSKGSIKSQNSVRSRGSIKSRGSSKSPASLKSPSPVRRSAMSPRGSIKSRSSIKSRGSSKSPASLKSPSPVRRSPMSPKSPDNSPARSINSYKSPERRGPVSPPPEDGNTSDSSVSSRGSHVSRESHGSRRSRDSRLSRRSVISRDSRRSVASRESRGSRRSLSRDSRGSPESRNSSRNKSNDRLDAQAEEISDGDMEYEGAKDSDDERPKSKQGENVKLNLSHEDLSDVSDLDSLGGNSEEEIRESAPEKNITAPTDLRQKLDEAKNRKLMEKQTNQNPPEKTSKTEDGEEQLDFEAEDGECVDEIPKAKPADGSALGKDEEEEGAIDEPGNEKEKEEVEEGEVTDDDEVRPEETEPRPVCRFYSRGQCTWGASCRFLHPGVTDKGNYTMFELIRPMVPGAPGYGQQDERFDRPGFGMPPIRGEAPVIESAWERGLRTAKEMMRKAIKRKEQDMDFEEKKMNLTLTQDELDKENGYYTRAASPIPVEPVPRHYVGIRHPLDYRQAEAAQKAVDVATRRLKRPPVTIDKSRQHLPVPTQPRVPEDYYSRRVVYEEPRVMRVEPEYEVPVPRERVRSYRELPAHRMPDYYNDKYEEPVAQTRRPKREVIVQRIEPSGRGDEWADPWMRSKSPGGGKGKSARFGTARRQSFSSASSYSSTSTTGSSKSTYRGESRSRSRSPNSRMRRRIGPGPKSPSHRVHRAGARAVSPSVIVSEKKAANERALLMNPPAPSPKKAHKDNRPPSPGMMRTSAQNPPAPTKSLTDQYGRTRDRSKHESERKKLAVAAALAASVKSRARVSRSSSGSDSSGSSSSDSESSYSSSSSSREGSPSSRRKVSEKVELAAMALKAKALDALKSGADKRQIKLSLKTNTLKKTDLSELARKASKEDLLGKKRLASSPPGEASAPKIAAVGKAAANSKKSTSRREELLKQLKAVEDAIAKKRSKIN